MTPLYTILNTFEADALFPCDEQGQSLPVDDAATKLALEVIVGACQIATLPLTWSVVAAEQVFNARPVVLTDNTCEEPEERDCYLAATATDAAGIVVNFYC